MNILGKMILTELILVLVGLLLIKIGASDGHKTMNKLDEITTVSITILVSLIIIEVIMMIWIK